MRPSRLLKIVFACVLLSMSLLACATFQQGQRGIPAANLVVSPSSGLTKEKITILGSGFIPGEVIEVIMVVDGVPTDLGGKPMVKKANDMGAFLTVSNIPWLAKPGVYTIRAEGDKGTVAVAPLAVKEKPKKKK
jgi:hypothetical protein